ncbi:hypothetical protein GCM10007880_57530 [Mesorhizobium amorphae]|nr:hypothetical protein GCM10007880_57530 [Mesorhizobium amorphae]
MDAMTTAVRSELFLPSMVNRPDLSIAWAPAAMTTSFFCKAASSGSGSMSFIEARPKSEFVWIPRV